ncbi:MAG: MFS transporter [Aureliella sp.]
MLTSSLPGRLAGRLPFFYGYVVALVAVVAQICSSPGQTFAISAFTPSFQADLGMNASQLAAAYMLGTFCAAFPLSIVGPMSDRFGIRATTLVVALALGGACVLLGCAHGFFSLFAGFLCLRFLGQGSITLLSSNMVAMWFQAKLGRVNAAMSVGGAAAFALVPILLLDSIELLGWRVSYFLMGGVVVLLMFPLTLFLLKDRPEELGLRPDGLLPEAITPGPADATGGDRENQNDKTSRIDSNPEFDELASTLADAIRQRAFWILAFAFGLWAMTGTGIIFYSLPIFEELGFSSKQASRQLFGFFSLAMLVGQVGGGILADRWSMTKLLFAGFASMAGAMWIMTQADAPWHVVAFAILFGAGQGLAIAVNGAIWVRYYGRQHLGKIRGAVWCTTVAGSGCGPFLLGGLKDWSGSFVPGLWLFFGLLACVTPFLLFATKPKLEMARAN